MKNLSKSLIALGSNLPSSAGDVSETLEIALQLLSGESVRIRARSRMFRTPAFPAGSGPDFVNAAIEVETTLSPDELLNRLHEVEATLGRTRNERWEPRVIDLDLLSFGELVLPDEGTLDTWMNLSPEDQRTKAPDQLVLPHPRMHARAFVLVPLMDIAPDWRHPRLMKTVAELVCMLPEDDLNEIVPLDA